MSKASRTDRTTRFITIGTIAKTRGTDGGLQLSNRETVSASALVGETVFLVPPTVEIHARVVTDAIDVDDSLVLFLEGISSRAQALEAVGRSVVAATDRVRSALAGRLPNAFGASDYDEMIGWSVIDEGGVELGSVSEVLETPAHAIIQVGRAAQAPILIPAVDEFIVSVDRATRSLRVHLIPGMGE